MSDGSTTGFLKVYDVLKGFGFIQREKGKDVFVRYVDFLEKDRDSGALIGSKVEFDVTQGPRGPRAKNVRIVG